MREGESHAAHALSLKHGGRGVLFPSFKSRYDQLLIMG